MQQQKKNVPVHTKSSWGEKASFTQFINWWLHNYIQERPWYRRAGFGIKVAYNNVVSFPTADPLLMQLLKYVLTDFNSFLMFFMQTQPNLINIGMLCFQIPTE